MGNTGDVTSDSSSETPPVDVKALAVQMLSKGVSSEEAAAQLTGVSDAEIDNSTEDVSSDESGESSSKKLGGHPAWQEILSAVPEEYHEMLTPKLKEWDAGVTRRFQEIHSQYEPLKVFEPIAEDIDADTLSSALGLFQAVNTNPEEVYRALGAAYGFASEQESSDDDEDDYSQLPPHIARQLEEQQRAIEALSEFAQTTQLTSVQQQEQEALNDYLGQLQDAYGDFDEDYVLTKMAAGVDGEVAVRQYFEIAPPVGGSQSQGQQTRGSAVTPPQVLGSSGVGSGGVPSTSVSPAKLGRAETKSLVEEILRASASQGN